MLFLLGIAVGGAIGAIIMGVIAKGKSIDHFNDGYKHGFENATDIGQITARHNERDEIMVYYRGLFARYKKVNPDVVE